MSGDDRSQDDFRRQSPFATGGLNAQLQRMLSAVLPVGGVPAGLHVDQDDLLEGGELYSSLSGGGLTGGLGGSGEGRAELLGPRTLSGQELGLLLLA